MIKRSSITELVGQVVNRGMFLEYIADMGYWLTGYEYRD